MHDEAIVPEKEMSPSIAKLAKALSAFQGDVANPAKDGDNPYFKSKYATLDGGLKSIRPTLAKHELSITQLPGLDYRLTTILMHSSGEWIRSTYRVVPADTKPQSLGSAISYARRYAFFSIVGVSAGDDDDGNVASAKEEPRTRQVKHIQHEDYHGEPVVQVDIPLKKTKEALKTEIGIHLEKLGQKGKTKAQVQKYIQDVTKLDPSKEDNYEEIEARLAILASEKFDE